MQNKTIFIIGVLLTGLLLNVAFFSNEEIDGDQFLRKKPLGNTANLSLPKDYITMDGMGQSQGVEAKLKVEENEPNQLESTSAISLSPPTDSVDNRVDQHREKIAEQQKRRQSYLLRKHSLPELPKEVKSNLSNEERYNFAIKFYGEHLLRARSDNLVGLARELSSDGGSDGVRLSSLASLLERSQREINLLKSKQLNEQRKSNHQGETPRSAYRPNINVEIEEMNKEFAQLNERFVHSLAHEISRKM